MKKYPKICTFLPCLKMSVFLRGCGRHAGRGERVRHGVPGDKGPLGGSLNVDVDLEDVVYPEYTERGEDGVTYRLSCTCRT